MFTRTTILNVLGVAILIVVASSMANAQATRTWVSGVGDDANPCSRTAPCKTFAGAISKTFIGGEIDALDPGGFGTVTITKSITIDGCCITSILASGTNGVNVNIAPNANDPERRVTLRHLTINGTGASGAVGTRTGLKGINYTQGLVLHVENCFIQNFTQDGIFMSHSASGGTVHVKDTNITNCNVGISIATTTGFVVGNMDHVRLEKMTSHGMVIGNHGHAHVSNCFIAFNGGDGVNIGASIADGTVNLESTFIASNGAAGIRNGTTGSIIDISNTSILQNATGIASASGAAGGGVNSHGNNQISGKTAAGTTPNPVGQQ
jgi:hypothetical protein